MFSSERDNNLLKKTTCTFVSHLLHFNSVISIIMASWTFGGNIGQDNNLFINNVVITLIILMYILTLLSMNIDMSIY